MVPFLGLSQGHSIDSLQKILPSLKGEARIDVLNELGFEYSNPYFSKSKYVRTDSALFYTLQAQKESLHINYTRGIGKAFQNLGMVEEEYGDYIKAEYFTRLAIPILEKANLQTELHRAWIALGHCFFHQGKYNEAIEMLQQELPYYQTVEDNETISMIFIMLGLNRTSQGYSVKAFENFQRSFSIQKKSNGILSILYSPERKADLYLGAGDTANALLYYRKVAANAKEHHVVLDYSSLIMSTIYTLQKQYDSAIFCLKKNMLFVQSSDEDSSFKKRELMLDAIDILPLYLLVGYFDSVIKYGKEPLKSLTSGRDIDNILPVLRDVTKAYVMKSAYKEALQYANQLLTFAAQAGARPFIRDAYLFLSEIFREQHKIDSAYKYQLQYSALNDSLGKDNYASRLAVFDAISKMKIEEENYKNQVKITEEKNKIKIELVSKEKQLQFYVFITAIVLIGLFTTSILRNYRLKRKKDHLQLMMTEANIVVEEQKREHEVAQLHQQKTELEMQALRAQMNPHFIFNCLSSINRFILINKTEEASDYLTKFSRLIRMALHNSEKSLITLESELEALRLYLDLERLRFKNAFNYSITFINTIDINTVYIPPMLIQPFAENAIWHGLMHKKGIGNLEIQLCANDKILTCAIIDNGIGRNMATVLNSRSAEKNKSMGIAITTGRLALLNKSKNEAAVFNIEDLMDEHGKGCGTKVVLTMPFKDLSEVVN